jgi:hypothetical protein
MNKSDIDKLLSTTFELEGLLSLASSRNNVSGNLEQLIADKCAELNALIAEFGYVKSSDTTESLKNNAGDSTLAFDAYYDVSEPEQKAETPLEPESVPVPVLEEEVKPKQESESEQSLQPYDASYSDAEADTQSADVLKAMFSINDKFRFARELFGGSSADMTSSLNLVASLSSVYEAEDYFYNDLQWNPETPGLEDFMAIVTRYFDTRK